VAAFLEGRLSFTGIPRVIGKIMARHCAVKNSRIDEIMAADRWSREEANALLERIR
jgi:1-deoxy-D-xylulose-5-phosphate reductoisomerase